MGLLGWEFGRLRSPEPAVPTVRPVTPLPPQVANAPQSLAPEHGAAPEGQIIYKGKVLRDPKAFMLGALSGQRALRFANRGEMEKFLQRAQGRFPIMDRQDGMLSLRIRVEDPAALDELLDGGEEQGFVFPVIPPNPRGGEVQANAVPVGEGLLEWLGVRKVEMPSF